MKCKLQNGKKSKKASNYLLGMVSLCCEVFQPGHFEDLWMCAYLEVCTVTFYFYFFIFLNK